jgi:hypothetical protein
MFQRDRVILKGRVEIGLGQMAGIAGLRKESQIGQPQVPDDPCQAVEGQGIGPPLKIGMGEQQATKQ